LECNERFYLLRPPRNVTSIRDDAQQTIYFRNRRVDPDVDYTYDAVSRLIEATGREHLGQMGGGLTAPAPLDDGDSSRVGLLHPGDGNALGRYCEQYIYDELGNVLQWIHRGTDPANPGWTRAFTYAEASQIEPAKTSNRLTRTQIGVGAAQLYTYDAHGNLQNMPHLSLMQWDYRDQLRTTARQVVRNGTPETTFYVYDADGQRVRKVTERLALAGETPIRKTEHIYLGDFEIYRKYGADGNTVKLERETLHVVDGEQTVALVETRTQGDEVLVQISKKVGAADPGALGERESLAWQIGPKFELCTRTLLTYCLAPRLLLVSFCGSSTVES
jgi:hypothetical protein